MLTFSRLFALILLTTALCFVACKSDDPPPPPPPAVAAGTITNLQVADIADNGNGLDMDITFDPAPDENRVGSYRILVLKSAVAAGFTLDQAEQLGTDRYTTVAKQGGPIQQVLPADARDTDGEAIVNEVAYKLIVMSVADGTTATLNALSAASNEVTLTSPPNPVAAPAVDMPTGADIDNYGDGRDLEVTFQPASDESLVDHYRIIAVTSASAAGFTLNAANALAQDQYVVVDKSGSTLVVTFAKATKDSDGARITEDVDYQVFVLSVADGTTATINGLSEASAAVKLERITTADVTYISNDGVMISDGNQVVLIDALHRMGANSGWITAPITEMNKIENASSPYDQVDLVLITHNHGDHYHSASINAHLTNNPNVRLIAPPAVAANFAGSSQVIAISPARGQKSSTIVNNIKVTILNMAHFIPPNSTGWPTMENYAYIVEIGGKRFLHLGDNAMTSANLKNLKIAEEEQIDVVMLPAIFSSIHLSASARDAMQEHIAPKHIIALHLLSGSVAQTSFNIKGIYPDATIFTTPFEVASY